MKQRLKIMLLSFVLLGCSMNPVSVVKDLLTDDGGMHVETEVVAGDKTEEINTEIGATSMQAEVITNIQETSPWVLILLVLGWFLPGPGAMWKGIMSLVGGKT